MKVNGKEINIKENTTVLEMLKSLNLNPETVVVEVNFEIISKESFESHILNEKDEIEIVSFVGGG